MRKSNLFIYLVLSLSLLFTLPSCGSDNDNDELQKQEEKYYNQFVTPELEEALLELGMPIYRGINPPNVEGYYRTETKLLATTNKDEESYIGTYFTDFKYNFYDQFDINISFLGYEILRNSNIYVTTHKAEGTFISGEGDKFSIYLEEVVTSGIYDSKILSIISGEVEREDGQIKSLKDLRYALLMKDRGGNPNVIQEGQGRLFVGHATAISKEEFEKLVGNPQKTSRKVIPEISILQNIN